MLAGVMRVMTSLAALTMAIPEDEIRVKDLLNPELLSKNLIVGNTFDGIANNTRHSALKKFDGNFDEALAVMDFHRRMMNEYLCRSYVAGQILSDVMASAAPRAERRVGSAASEDGDEELDEPAEGLSGLLADPGSAGYNDWLSRATTLEDMYNSHAEMDDYYDEDTDLNFYTNYDEVEYEEPELDLETFLPPVPETRRPYMEMLEDSKFAASDYVAGQEVEPSHRGHYGGEVHRAPDAHPGMSKEDMFELVCTAMALMAFAMFKMNIIMCITQGVQMSSGNGGGAVPAAVPAGGLMMVVRMPPALPPLRPPAMGGGRPAPTTAAPPPATTAAGDGGDGSLEEGGDFNITLPMRLRLRRAAREGAEDAVVAEEMARRALLSLEAFHSAGRDGARCLRRWLCDNNRFSRRLQPRHAAWLPLWSVAMSWFGGGAALGNVRAAVLGLGAAPCERQFPGCSAAELGRRRRARP